MATFWSGNGGKVTKSSTDINVKEWTLQKSTRLADITHSGSSGWAIFKGTVKEASGTVKASWDSTQLPEATLSMDVGAEVALTLVLGGSTKTFTFTAVIETLNHQCNNQTGEVTYDFTFKAITAVTAPS